MLLAVAQQLNLGAFPLFDTNAAAFKQLEEPAPAQLRIFANRIVAALAWLE